MSTDPNWLSPPSNEQNDSAREAAAHTLEAAPTVAPSPLEKPSPKSAWVILALVGGIAGAAMSCFALALIPFAFLQPAALRSINSASTTVVSFISISGVGLRTRVRITSLLLGRNSENCRVNSRSKSGSCFYMTPNVGRAKYSQRILGSKKIRPPRCRRRK